MFQQDMAVSQYNLTGICLIINFHQWENWRVLSEKVKKNLQEECIKINNFDTFKCDGKYSPQQKMYYCLLLIDKLFVNNFS